jgi:hypothetical protein
MTQFGWAHASAGVTCAIRLCAETVLLMAWLAVSAAGVPPAAAQTVNACSILSAADIQSTLGIAVTGEGKAVDVGVRHSCDWMMANGANLRLAVFTSPKAETLTSGPTSGPQAWEPLTGLGEKAGYRRYNFTLSMVSSEVQVVLADRTFFVQVMGHVDQMPAKDPLIALARLVIARLP